MFRTLANPLEWDNYKRQRLFIKTTGTPGSGGAYPWTEQEQSTPGVFADDPNAIAIGTTTDFPAYMADGSTIVPVGTVCEAVVHYGGWLIAWPISATAIVAAGSNYHFALSISDFTAATADAPGVGLLEYYTADFEATGIISPAVNACGAFPAGWWLDVHHEPFAQRDMVTPRCERVVGSDSDSSGSGVGCGPCASTHEQYCVSILGLIGTSIGGGLCTHCDRLSAVTVTRSAFSPCFWFSDVAPCSDDPDFPDWYVQVQIYDHFMTVSVYDYMNAIANYSADISSWDCVSELTLLLDEPVGGVGEAVCHNWPSSITVTPGVCVGSSDSGLSSGSDSGIEIIGLETASTEGTPASTLTIPSFSVSDGLLVVAVAAFAPDSAATVAVTFDGTPLTVLQLNSTDSAGDILAVCYLPVSAGTGALVVSLGGVNADIEVACHGILNLANNALDRVSADANGSSSQPITNTTLTTTAANEAAIGVFGVRGDVSASIWSGSGLLLVNNAIDGSLGVDVELTVGAAVLGSTQTVFGSLALASPPQPDWFGLVVTFK